MTTASSAVMAQKVCNATVATSTCGPARSVVVSPATEDGQVEVARFADGWTFAAVDGRP